MNHKGRFFSALFLIAGTSIGGGMLALPVEVGMAGFFPALILMFCCYLFMTLTGLLITEANLWMKGNPHIFSMASYYLGRWGRFFALILYLFISYASLIAYTSGGGQILEQMSNMTLTLFQSGFIFALLFCLFLFLGAVWIGRLNNLLVVFMVITYFGMVSMGIGEIKPHLLLQFEFQKGFSALPLLLTIFSFQTMLPSIINYLHRDAKLIKNAVIWGMFLAFIIYAIWLVIALGVIPKEQLKIAYEEGLAATIPLKTILGRSLLSFFAEYFAFFAISTSFLGIGFGLFDFLFDVTKMRRTQVAKFIVFLMILVPTMLFGLFYPRAFLVMLDVTGGFGDAFLNGLFPIFMVYIGAYLLHFKPKIHVTKKALLFFLMLFALLVIIIQIRNFFVAP